MIQKRTTNQSVRSQPSNPECSVSKATPNPKSPGSDPEARPGRGRGPRQETHSRPERGRGIRRTGCGAAFCWRVSGSEFSNVSRVRWEHRCCAKAAWSFCPGAGVNPEGASLPPYFLFSAAGCSICFHVIVPLLNQVLCSVLLELC